MLAVSRRNTSREGGIRSRGLSVPKGHGPIDVGGCGANPGSPVKILVCNGLVAVGAEAFPPDATAEQVTVLAAADFEVRCSQDGHS